ncbi:MAG: Rieske (2Fe-2S) protein [Gammaproteobacteria bacterium]|nr:Rieske (2Fe-2S) protein [Gammaproteobacteria bacterium]
MGDLQDPADPPTIKRRRVLQACCGLALTVRSAAQADDADAAAAPPRENDLLVHAFGPRAGEVVAPGDIEANAEQILVYPMDPATGTVRDGTRLNQLILVRLDPDTLAPETRQRSAEGIVAYSGVCTHTGCDVTDWYDDVLRFKCPCHESEFDPSDGARVIGGPAPSPLAALPLKIADGVIAVAGAFVGTVGFTQPGFDTFGP